MLQILDGYRYLFAFIERLKEANVHGASGEPLRTEVFDDSGGEVSINSYARNQAARESVFGGNLIVVNFVFGISGGVDGADEERRWHRDQNKLIGRYHFT